MGKLYQKLSLLLTEARADGSQVDYQEIVRNFVLLIIYKDNYLLDKLGKYVYLKKSGDDMFIDCGHFGIIVDKDDNVSTHT